jgi:hypothetical protein
MTTKNKALRARVLKTATLKAIFFTAFAVSQSKLVKNRGAVNGYAKLAGLLNLVRPDSLIE